MTEVRIGQRGVVQVRIRKVLADKVDARKIVRGHHNAGQIVGLVAGRRVKLGYRNSAIGIVRRVIIELCPADVGIGEICAIDRRSPKVRISEIGLAEIGIGQRCTSQIGIREVRLTKIRAGQRRGSELCIGQVLGGEVCPAKLLPFNPIPVKSCAW